MFTLQSAFRKNGTLYETTQFDNDAFALALTQTDGEICAVLTAKTDLDFSSLSLSCPMDFAADDLFFANGYQSWTTSREYGNSDTAPTVTRLAHISRLTTELAAISGDHLFAPAGGKGVFHSYTYCYFRKRDSREITLYGSKSERQGFTVFIADMQNGVFTLRKDIEGLHLKSGQVYEVFCIAEISGEFDSVFDRYFFDFVGVQKPDIPRLAGYTSWYNYFQKIDEHIILRDLAGLDCAKDAVNIFQVDDGYESAVGDWLTPDSKKFPHGMGYIAEKIHEKGYKAGLWLAPFNAQRSSRILKEHPDWVIRDNRNGKPLLGCVGWGGAYTFDIYNAEFRAYLKKVFDTVLLDWGFDLVKLDFLYSQCMQPRAGKTRGEIMCDAVDLLRELCYDKRILGCGVPLGACMGIFDACRIGCDANKVFKPQIPNKLGVNPEIPSSQNAINNAIFRNHLDGRAFACDPDVFFLRDNNLKYTLQQKLLLGKVNAVCGNVLFVSDNAGDYDAERVAYLKDFFADKNYKVLSAQYEDSERIRLRFSENGAEKELYFNILTGDGNVAECL